MPSTHPKTVEPQATPRRMVSHAEAAEHYGVTTRTIYQWIVEGKITGYKMGGIRRVDLNEIDAAFTPYGGAVR